MPAHAPYGLASARTRPLADALISRMESYADASVSDSDDVSDSGYAWIVAKRIRADFLRQQRAEDAALCTPVSSPLTWDATSGRYQVTLADGSTSERTGHGHDVATQMADAAGITHADFTYATDTDGMLVDCARTGRWALVQVA